MVTHGSRRGLTCVAPDGAEIAGARVDGSGTPNLPFTGGLQQFLGPGGVFAGQRWIVNVSFDSPAFICGEKRPFRAFTFPTGFSLRAYPRIDSRSSADLDFSDLRPLKLFPAQRNPKDPSMLTFKYQLGPTEGLIDARLQDDGTVVFFRRK